MKIFTTGDTHGNFERLRPEYFPEGLELTKEDVVRHVMVQRIIEAYARFEEKKK